MNRTMKWVLTMISVLLLGMGLYFLYSSNPDTQTDRTPGNQSLKEESEKKEESSIPSKPDQPPDKTDIDQGDEKNTQQKEQKQEDENNITYELKYNEVTRNEVKETLEQLDTTHDEKAWEAYDDILFYLIHTPPDWEMTGEVRKRMLDVASSSPPALDRDMHFRTLAGTDLPGWENDYKDLLEVVRTHPDPELKREVATDAIGGDLSQSARLLMDRGHTAEEARSLHEDHTKEIEEWAREEYYGSSHNSENRQRWKEILNDIQERRKKIEEFDWDNVD